MGEVKENELLVLDLVKAAIIQKFKPAADEVDADLLIGNEKLCEHISVITGEGISFQEISLLMTNLGFKFISDDSLNFVWILKEK